MNKLFATTALASLLTTATLLHAASPAEEAAQKRLEEQRAILASQDVKLAELNAKLEAMKNALKRQGNMEGVARVSELQSNLAGDTCPARIPDENLPEIKNWEEVMEADPQTPPEVVAEQKKPGYKFGDFTKGAIGRLKVLCGRS